MSSRTLLRALAAAAGAVGLAALPTAAADAATAPACPTPGTPLTFDKPSFVDTERAGGEPLVMTHPDGTIIYTSHAGTTHVYGPEAANPQSAAFGEHYEGQTYIWNSKDGGRTWQFIPRLGPDPDKVGEINGVPASGFSDSELAIDQAGFVYESEINLVNVAVSKSEDEGESYQLQNFFGEDLTDRQWSAADQKDVLYLDGNPQGSGGTFPTKPVGNTSHTMYKSVDGGKTFDGGLADSGGLGDIQVDPNTGTLYEAVLSGGALKMRAFRNARDFVSLAQAKADGRLVVQDATIASGVDMLAHWPAFDIDREGNLYITWDEGGGNSNRPAGIYYSYSADQGRSWAPAVRVDRNDNTDIWPWIAVGDPGRVAIAWFGADTRLPNQDAETPGTHGWRVFGAVSTDGLGCAESRAPGFDVATATPDPIHTGTICQSGTTCEATATDRRLGDFFSIDVDSTGHMYAGYSDTSRGGMVSLPAFVRQSGGPSLFAPGAAHPAAGMQIQTGD